MTILPKILYPGTICLDFRSDCLKVLDLVHDLVLEGHSVDGILLLELVQVVKLPSTSGKVALVRVDKLGLVDDWEIDDASVNVSLLPDQDSLYHLHL